ncbi:HvfX family Cu-binding RiPP maturation protein [Endozoicomonas numazuensis]|uniref:AraC family transcriptional regulator n=1 Tax=Endozoicomonas numazuensis TaxID=1137799 RepID=A0A081NHJ0_9GAMM|nr:DoxX family protein [Endozoicomonas numazuensis]KEQ17913.1 AraC family transcriptional regulator [Endozoicomonas numazuensis]
MIQRFMQIYDNFFEKLRRADFVALLLIRLYLIPVIYTGAHSKVVGFSTTVEWFGASIADGGLNLPFPTLLAFLATSTEVVGLICIALGLFTRLLSIPLMFMMSAASLLVHLPNGWLVLASKSMESSQRLSGFMTWLAQNFPERFNYVTELGDPVMLNNGIEFAATYFIMFLALFFYGGGRYVSADYWLKKKFSGKNGNML